MISKLIVAALCTIRCLHLTQAAEPAAPGKVAAVGDSEVGRSAAGRRATFTIDAVRVCLEALERYSHTWSGRAPRAIAIRLSDDQAEVNCRASARVAGNHDAPSLYQVTLDAADLHVIAIRQRTTGGHWTEPR